MTAQHKTVHPAYNPVRRLDVFERVHPHEPCCRRVDIVVDSLAHNEWTGNGLCGQNADQDQGDEQHPPVWTRKLQQTRHKRCIKGPFLGLVVRNTSHYSFSTLCSTSCLLKTRQYQSCFRSNALCVPSSATRPAFSTRTLSI